MSSVNKVILIGRLGADPEVKTLPSGQQIASFSLATSESYNDKDGQRQERTEWHRVTLWAKLAELAGRYLQKGAQVYIEGRLQTRSWDDQQTGQKRYQTEVVGSQMTILGKSGGSTSDSDSAFWPRRDAGQRQQANFDDMVPF